MIEKTNWQNLWQEAKIAQENGRVAQAFDLFSGIPATIPPIPEPWQETGDFFLSLARELKGIRDLYNRHFRHFNVPVSEYSHSAIVPPITDRFIGEKYRSFINEAYFEAGLRSQEPGWQCRVADLYEFFGDLDAALNWRLRIGKTAPASAENLLTLQRLFDAIDCGHLDIAKHQDFLTALPHDSSGILIRSLYAPCRTSDERFMANISDRIEEYLGRFTSHYQRADELCCLAWTAANMPTIPPTIMGRLKQWVDETTQHLPTYFPARLAGGYLDFLHNAETGKRSLAIASQIAGMESSAFAINGGQSQIIHQALHSARAFITGQVSHPKIANQGWPAININHLRFVHAKALGDRGRCIEALSAASDAVDMKVTRNTPISYEIYGDYKILLNEGTYYAVPRHVIEFTIIKGTVYRVSAHSYMARLRIPQWLRSIGMTYILTRIKAAFRSPNPYLDEMRPLKRFVQFAISIAMHRYVVRNVIKAHDRETIFALADGKLKTANKSSATE